MGIVVGIDLGTTFSSLAYVNEAGLPQAVTNQDGANATPSVVFFDRNVAVVGAIAREALVTHPEAVVQHIKRRMGTNWEFEHGDDIFRPEQISALIVRKLVQDAERVIGPIDQAVITVPADFNDAMRAATKLAGEMAGIEVPALINEPTAAAIAFGLQQHLQDKLIAVCDLGGGTFDVTIMQVQDDAFQVQATGGDNYLGGANFDKRLVDRCMHAFNRQFGIDLTDPDVLDLDEMMRTAQEWLRRAERMKRDLTVRPQAATSLSALGKTMRMEVTIAEFELLSAPLLDDIEDKIRDTMAAAALSNRDIDMVILVGGSTRMPMVRQRIAEVFEQSPNVSVNPDEAIALGAALFSTSRAIARGQPVRIPEQRRQALSTLRVMDVASHSLGVAAYERITLGGGDLQNSIVLQRNVPLPASSTRTYYTVEAGQTSVRITVLEGDHPNIEHCLQIGEFYVSELPAGRPASQPVDITMRYNTDGILEVQALDQVSQRQATIRIDRLGVLADDQREEATQVVARLPLE